MQRKINLKSLTNITKRGSRCIGIGKLINILFKRKAMEQLISHSKSSNTEGLFEYKKKKI